MAKSIILAGPHIRVYVNNVLYKEVQSVSLRVSYNETPIFGIDAPYAQEIASVRTDVNGAITGLRVKNSGGLQAKNLRPLFQDLAAAPYVSIRIQDRDSEEDIVFIPNAKVSNESHTVSIKGSYKLSFEFTGQIALWALDRS